MDFYRCGFGGTSGDRINETGQTMTKIDQIADRIVELEELAAAEGITLPMPASVIALHEQAGHVVDLYSGHLVTDGGEARYSLGPALLVAGGAA